MILKYRHRHSQWFSRQAVEVATRANPELEAHNIQTREALTQAERQVMQARFVAEQEVIQARQATMEAQAAQHRSQQLLTIAEADFDRMQEQMNSLQDLVQQQREVIQQLQSQRVETKQPSNGTEHPVMQQCTRILHRAVRSLRESMRMWV